ncbi:MAG: molybdate ABC transporter permease subunit, partial [Methylococcales bacterium]|nr:molybdate ABC transporter permease subunit [Methylococcales bacterium]
MLSAADMAAIWLTLKVASLATSILLLLGTPLAWWLARTEFRGKSICNALVALPLVLPPSVLGFYLLVLMGPNGAVGKLTTELGLGTL